MKKFDIFTLRPRRADRATINSRRFDGDKKFAVKAVIPRQHRLIINLFALHQGTLAGIFGDVWLFSDIVILSPIESKNSLESPAIWTGPRDHPERGVKDVGVWEHFKMNKEILMTAQRKNAVFSNINALSMDDFEKIFEILNSP